MVRVSRISRDIESIFKTDVPGSVVVKYYNEVPETHIWYPIRNLAYNFNTTFVHILVGLIKLFKNPSAVLKNITSPRCSISYSEVHIRPWELMGSINNPGWFHFEKTRGTPGHGLDVFRTLRPT